MDNAAREFKIGVQGLKTGMYVSRLDRPWLGTEYPLEGFKVGTDAEVDRLQVLCTHVFIDVTRGSTPELRYIELDALLEQPEGREEFAALHSTTWQLESDFQGELPQAKHAHEALKRGIDEVMRDLQEGHDLQISKLQGGVQAMIESITRNPTAFNWLKELKRKDDYAYHHALACSVWAASFGRHLGLGRQQLTELTLAGLLFDIGKTRLAPELLANDKSYSESDRRMMDTHVQHGLDILGETPGVSPRIIEAVATHHERHDGSGFPRGLSKGSIPIFGRILGLIDSYDAMTSIRPHMPSRSPHQAVMELYESRDKLFQAELVEQFIQTSGIYPTGSLVELSDGQVGVVTAVHSLKRLRPSVMLLLDANKKPLLQFKSVDLGAQQQKKNGKYPLSIQFGLPQGAYGIDPIELFLD